MRHRNNKIQIWIDDKEAQKLLSKSAKCNLSKSSYIRHLINDFIPREAPPPEYYNIIRELRAIGNNMHQISYRANSMGLLDAPMYRKNAERVTDVCDFLMSAFTPKT